MQRLLDGSGENDQSSEPKSEGCGTFRESSRTSNLTGFGKLATLQNEQKVCQNRKTGMLRSSIGHFDA
jgi:hypothetical protein